MVPLKITARPAKINQDTGFLMDKKVKSIRTWKHIQHKKL